MNSRLRNKLIFIIALLLMNYRVNLVGSMSLTEFYVVTQIPHLLKWLNGYGKRIPNLQKIAKGFYWLIAAQVVSEIVIQNSIINAAKGIAITVMALFLMLFFLEKLLKDISLLFWIPVCSIVGLLIFGDQFGFADQGETTFFKFYVAPIIAYLGCALTLVKWKWVHRNVIMVLLAGALFIIIGGARSLGFSLLFTVFFYWVYSRYKTIKLRKILPGIFICAIVIQCFLTFVYVPKVKSGEWGSQQNREQFALIDWNSNIFVLLFAARTDFFVSTMAFMDNPLWGHGSWAMDTKLKYYLLQAKLLNKESKTPEALKMIPNHSVVMGKGVANGVFAFVIFLWIFISMYRIGLKGLSRNSPYNIFLIWTIISSFQHLMFGPPAVLKNNGAIAFAIMLVLYYMNYKGKCVLCVVNDRKNEIGNRVISSYSDV